MDYKELIKHGSSLRENNELLKALETLTRALVACGKKGDYLGMINALVERCLVWRHYYSQTKDDAFLVLAREDAKAMKQIADMTNTHVRDHTALFLMGNLEMLLGNFGNAVFYFKDALKYFKGGVAEKGDWRRHLGEALYKNGQEGVGKKAILKGIEEIKKGAKGVDSFLVKVWLSGAYMTLAELQANAKPKEARQFLNKATEIIKNDKRLVLREIQLRELRRKFV